MGGKYGSKRAIAPERECEVIELYKQVHCTRLTAEAFGVSDETIRRILKRNGVPRKKPSKQKNPKHLRRLWDDSLTSHAIEMYESGKNCKEIAKELSYSATTIYKRLKAAGVIEDAARRLDDDQTAAICELYESGISNKEIAARFGISPQTVSKVARRIGCVMRGRETNGTKGGTAYAKIMRGRAIERLNANPAIELVEFGSPAKVRCKKCGTEYEWTRESWRSMEPCPGCRELQRNANRVARDRKQYEREQQREAASEWRLSVPRICKECGEPFNSESVNATYCCDECRNRADNRRAYERRKKRGIRANGYRHRMRIKVTRLTYDRTVTLDAVYKKFRGHCCECGCETERTRDYSPRMATLDHVIALSNNGTHTWDNVQLLCSSCNSNKRDLGQMRLPIAI